MNVLLAIVRKDIQTYLADRRAVITSFLVPIMLACFFGAMMSNTNSGKPTKAMPIGVTASAKDLAALRPLLVKAGLDPVSGSETELRAKVRDGKLPAALVLENGFVAKMTDGGRPVVTVVDDPGRKVAGQAATGMALQALGRLYGGQMALRMGMPAGGADTARTPFTVRTSSVAEPEGDKWAGVGHAFSGMALQGLLFFSVECGLALLRERRSGVWRRVLASPTGTTVFTAGRLLSGTLISLAIGAAVFLAGAAFFGLRILGSVPGFALLLVASAILAAAFGLFVAAIGRNESQARGVSILLVLAMQMLGGAWFPPQFMPDSLQRLGQIIPTRHAVDGFDSVLWKGEGFGVAASQSAILLAFSVAFVLFALARFRRHVVVS